METKTLIGIIPLYFRSITDTLRQGKFPNTIVDHSTAIHLQEICVLLTLSQQFITIEKPDVEGEFKYKSFIKEHLEEHCQISRKMVRRCKLINDKKNLHLYLVWLEYPKITESYQWRKFILSYPLSEKKYNDVFNMGKTNEILIFQQLLEKNTYLEDYTIEAGTVKINLRYILEYIIKLLEKMKK